jgi:6-pyruvoyltetrahydropterin/6-carboxytetrahydropterin synthase
MPFEIGIAREFDATHHLVGDFGPASQPHGHRYRVEVSASGQELHPDGTLFDITLLQTAVTNALATLEGRDLNTLPQLAQPNPTAEVVARWLHEQVAQHLPAFALRVQVWESPEAYASYEP